MREAECGSSASSGVRITVHVGIGTRGADYLLTVSNQIPQKNLGLVNGTS
jgi:hypothetical protein